MKKEKYDFIIIGAGIIGCMISRYLSKYKLNILLMDKESDIGTGASSRNSAIIHSGHDPIPGSLKSILNIRGNTLWENIANDLSISFKRTGSYVIAISDEEHEVVKKLYERAILNGVPRIEVLKKDEILYREPKVNPEVKSALYTPTTGVIDPFEAVIASCENAITNGVNLSLNTEFYEFIINGKKINGISTNKGDIYCRYVVNCTGLYSDLVMHKVNIKPEFKVRPTRGEYFIFDSAKVTLNTVLYPTPTEKGKGTLVSTTTHGNVMVGPNADVIDDKEDSATTKEGLEKITLNAKKLVPSLDIKDVIAQFAGIRAKGNEGYKDFIIEIPSEIQGLINLGAIDSPGLASAPAIAEKVIDLLKANNEQLIEKKEWNPKRKSKPCFKKLSHLEKMELVKKNPNYGKVICRCEEVTEGEILEAIHSLIPAKTYDAIKRRTWMGTGRCQGAFDYHRVIEILSRELNISEIEVTKKGRDSKFIFKKTKE